MFKLVGQFFTRFSFWERKHNTICLFLADPIIVISAVLGVVQCCILRVMCVACVNCKQPGGGGQRRLETLESGHRPGLLTLLLRILSPQQCCCCWRGMDGAVPVWLWGQQDSVRESQQLLACTHLNLSIYHQSSVVRVVKTAQYLVPQLPSQSPDLVQAQNICDWMKCAVNEFE